MANLIRDAAVNGCFKSEGTTLVGQREIVTVQSKFSSTRGVVQYFPARYSSTANWTTFGMFGGLDKYVKAKL